jgi:hypothetical protein
MGYEDRKLRNKCSILLLELRMGSANSGRRAAASHLVRMYKNSQVRQRKPVASRHEDGELLSPQFRSATERALQRN